jgi:mannose-6-phosphate isomerase
VKIEPARIEPVFVSRIWGARSLTPLFPERPVENESVGEVWLTGNDCRIANGPFSGWTLGEAWREMGPEWTGTRVRDPERCPLLVKFIFPEQKLSIQAHPDDDYAQRHEAASGGRGKTEMWYAIEARPGAEVMVGLRPGVTRESFRRAIKAGTVEECLARVPVRTGDSIFVPAGTAHTIGPGMVLCEIQEHSDITYRVFDYNRLTAEGKPRPLHIERALNVIQFGEQKGGKVSPIGMQQGPMIKTYLVACRYFATERWESRERIPAATDPAHFDLLIFLAGSGRIEFGGESRDFVAGQAWFLPAALGTYQLAPVAPTALLRTYVPDLDNFVRGMKDEGIAESAAASLVHR